MSAANWIGMNANQYLHRYGATREMLGWIALNGRANAARNPAAIYRDPMTMDDYLSARPITTPVRPLRLRRPVRRVDRRRSCPTPSVAGDLPKPAVRIDAVGTQILERISWDQDTDHPRAPGARPVGPPLDPDRPDARPTSTSPSLYDGFTFNAISWLEAPRLLRASARPRTGSTAAAASPSTASCR